MLILDTPTLAHIPGLLAGFADNAAFAKYRWKDSEGSKDHIVRAIFHLCGENILEDPRYKSFMNGFGPEVNVRVQEMRGFANLI